MSSAIIAYSPSRLFRDYRTYEHLGSFLKSRDVKLFFAYEGGEHLDQRRPLEFLQEECSAAMDQQILEEYTKLHGHRIRRTLLAKAEQGIWPARPPIGYKAAVLQCAQRGILPDEHTAGLIWWLFNEYATGDYSLQQLVEVLRLRKYGLSISRSKIVHILRNPFYTGDFVWKGKLFRGSHEPIIPHALWERVQSVLSRVLGNGSKQKRMAGSEEHRAEQTITSDSGCLHSRFCKRPKELLDPSAAEASQRVRQLNGYSDRRRIALRRRKRSWYQRRTQSTGK